MSIGEHLLVERARLGRGPTDMSRYEDPPDDQRCYVPTNIARSLNPTNVYSPNPLGICSPNVHYFGCSHEKVCFCGLTERLPLEVAEGL